MTRFARCDKMKSNGKHTVEDATSWEELRISQNDIKISMETSTNLSSHKKKKKSLFKAIINDSTVQENLNLSQNNINGNVNNDKSDSKPKKAKKKCDDIKISMETSTNLSSHKKKKKSLFKANINDSDVQEILNLSQNNINENVNNDKSDSKPKKAKKKCDVSIKDNSFEGDENIDFRNTSSSTKIKKHKSALTTDMSTDLSSADSAKKIKKHDGSIREKKENFNNSVIEDDKNKISNDILLSNKKKRCKSSLKNDISIEQSSVASPKKKKKHVSKEILGDNSLMVDDRIDISNDTSSSKKKKRKSALSCDMSLDQSSVCSGKKKKRKICEENTDESVKKNLDTESSLNNLQDENDLDGNFFVEDKVKKVKKQKNLENKKKTKEIKDKSAIQLKLGFIMEDGVKYKMSKKGKKRPWIDLVYQENDDMTMYNKLYVKKSDVDHLDEYKKKLKEEGFSEREVTKKVFTRERRAHNKLRVEMMKQQIKTINDNSDEYYVQHKKNHNINLLINKSNKNKRSKSKNQQSFEYVENDLMTNYDGWWVLKSNVEKIESIKYYKVQDIINSRSDGNTSETLTEEEQASLNRQMKKVKRSEHYYLQTELSRSQSMKNRKFNNYKEYENNEYNNINDYSNEKVIFDGIFVKKEGAERLQELKDNLKKKGCLREELRDAMKLERRKEERELKRENKLICYNCRKPGHTVSQCQQNKSMNVCYRCGSADHIARDCNVQGSFAHASCFYCNETGHIARECPDNPKKLYINGGGCRECGSVEHFRRDCPEYQKKKKEHGITPKMIDTGGDLDF